MSEQIPVPSGDPGASPTDAEASPLVVAYHAVFDVKDACEPGSAAFYAAYEACRQLADLMVLVGVEPPERFDAPRNAV